MWKLCYSKSMHAYLWGFFALSGAVAASGCASTASRVYQASTAPCLDVVAHHATVSKSSDYAEIPVGDRQSYELRVARCDLELHDTKAALALADSWSSESAQNRLRIDALAAAQQRDEAGCRLALEQLSATSVIEPEFLTENEDFLPYAGRDWFIAVAARTWGRRPGEDMSPYVAVLARLGRRSFLPLGVAAGDPTRPIGEWAFWTGVVREGRIDRANGVVVLTVDEVLVSNDLRVLDRKVTSVHGRRIWFAPSGDWKATPEYDTTRDYQESFTPTGRRFVVTYHGLDEQLLALRALQAFGNFAGLDEKSQLPALNAITIVERNPRRTTERSHD
jgi:hypothetical protein